MFGIEHLGPDDLVTVPAPQAVRDLDQAVQAFGIGIRNGVGGVPIGKDVRVVIVHRLSEVVELLKSLVGQCVFSVRKGLHR